MTRTLEGILIQAKTNIEEYEEKNINKIKEINKQ